MLRHTRASAVLALLCAVFLTAPPAWASYVVKDGNGVTQTMCSVTAAGVQTPCHAQPDSSATGTLNSATLNAAYTVTLGQGQGTVAFTVTGLTAAAAVLTVEGSNDGGTTWSAINRLADGVGGIGTTVSADGQFRVTAAGRTAVRLRVSTIGTGTVSLASNASAARLDLEFTASAQSAVTGSVTPATIGTSSGQVLAAAARRLLAIDNESATATIACAFGATAAINTAGSYTIAPGYTRVWDKYPVPAEAVNCIASAASTPATVEAN